MLLELRIRDFAVIRDLSLRAGAGLTVLSGETGAGKSIIVGALGLLLGERASSQTVRKGARRALVEAVFDVTEEPRVLARLGELGVAAEDGLLVLRREVSAEGRSRGWLNGSPATAGLVGELGSLLVDIHGQHEHQSLLRAAEQRRILDAFAGADELAGEVGRRFEAWRGWESLLREKAGRVRDLRAKEDFLRFQVDEIRQARLRHGEEEELQQEASRLQHAEELALGTRGLHEALYEGEASLTDRLAGLQGTLERLARLDPALGEVAGLLEEAYHLLVEAARRLGDYAEGIEPDPGRLEEVRRRQELLFRLKRKYGATLEEVLETGSRLEKELQELEGADVDLQALEAQVEEAHRAFLQDTRRLSEARRRGAEGLERAMEALLPELGLPGARFQVALFPLAEPGGGGAERVEFLVSLNPGFDPGPLQRIASGGELSRVMLALKTVLGQVDPVPTLIFDEIDAGIGGEVAVQVAAKLREVSRRHQVFVITHLPQIASRAHHHWLVEKVEVEGLASTVVRELEGEERIRELARMLGGDPESATSREHARELLGSS